MMSGRVLLSNPPSTLKSAASASTSPATVYSEGSTATSWPASRTASLVTGPIDAIATDRKTASASNPASARSAPKCRNVDGLVNVTASTEPAEKRSSTAWSGCARIVR